MDVVIVAMLACSNALKKLEGPKAQSDHRLRTPPHRNGEGSTPIRAQVAHFPHQRGIILGSWSSDPYLSQREGGLP